MENSYLTSCYQVGYNFFMGLNIVQNMRHLFNMLFSKCEEVLF